MDERKLRVAFVIPPVLANRGDYKRAAESIGTQLLASMALKQGCEVLVIDSALEGFGNLRHDDGFVAEWGLPDSKIRGRIEKFAPDLICTNSVAMLQAPALHSMVKMLGKAFPNTPIFAGGAGADGLPEMTLSATYPYLRAVCIHEGFAWLSRIMEAIKKGEDLQQVLGNTVGSAFMNEGRFVQVVGITLKGDAEFAKLEQALKASASIYSQQWKGMLVPDEKLCSLDVPQPDVSIIMKYPRTPQPTYADRVQTPGKYFDLFYAAGCTNACPFCASNSRMGWLRTKTGEWRLAYTQEELSSTLASLRQGGFDHVIIQDDNFTRLPPNIWKEGLRIMFRQGFTHQNNGGFEPEALKRGDLKFMAENGCTCAYVPLNPRHGSAHFNAKTAVHLARLLAEAKESGMYVYGGFILGSPGQTLEQMASDLLFARVARECGLFDDFIIYGYTCLPDTRDFDRFAMPGGGKYGVAFDPLYFPGYSNNIPQCATGNFALEDFAALWHYSIEFIKGKEAAKAYFEEGTWFRGDQKEVKADAAPDLEGFYARLGSITDEMAGQVLADVQKHKQSAEFRGWWDARQQNVQLRTDERKELMDKLKNLERILLVKGQTGAVTKIQQPPRKCWNMASAR